MPENMYIPFMVLKKVICEGYLNAKYHKFVVNTEIIFIINPQNSIKSNKIILNSKFWVCLQNNII